MSTELTIPSLVTEVGLDLVGREFSREEWALGGGQLGRLKGAIDWSFGDWLNYGEQHYGEEYAQYIEVLGSYSNNTLRNWQWVCERIPLSRRVSALRFAHHQAVAALEPVEQDEWLAEAWANGWSVAELKRQIKGEPEPEPEVSDRNHCPHCAKDIRNWLLDHGWRDND